MKHVRGVIFSALTALLLVSAWGSQTQAQPVLNFKRVINNWPTVELYFAMACNGQPEYTLDKQYFSVKENGSDINNFTLWCPDPRQKCSISAALVFDASGSMMTSMQSAIDAGNAFVNLMDGVTDEAAVIWFNDQVTVQQTFTTNKTDLHNAVNNLQAGGGGAVWDGIYAGVQELIIGGAYACRAVVVVTDGLDNASSHTPADIIALAQRNRIRVYVAGVNISSPAQMEVIALQTGGKYYQATTPSTLATIYEEISTFLFTGFLECLITYESNCPDGMMREVELGVNNFCLGDDFKTRSFRVPLDTTVVDQIALSIEDVTMAYGEQRTIPVRYRAPNVATIGPAELRISYAPDIIADGTINMTGTALENIPTTVKKNNGQFTITIDQPVQILGDGILLNMELTARNSASLQTQALDLINWIDGIDRCLHVAMSDGSVTIPTTGIGSFAGSLAKSFTIAPNPSDGAFEVVLEFDQPTAFSTRVVNALGQTVYENQVSGKRVSYRGSIQLTDAPPGIYFFLVQSANNYDYRKIIVK